MREFAPDVGIERLLAVSDIVGRTPASLFLVAATTTLQNKLTPDPGIPSAIAAAQHLSILGISPITELYMMLLFFISPEVAKYAPLNAAIREVQHDLVALDLVSSGSADTGVREPV